MSTSDYLSGLSLEQLRFARERADDLIAAKEAEKQCVVWCAVHGSSIRIEYFRTDEYAAAVEYLAEEGRRLAADPNVRRQDRRLSLDFTTEPQSVYDEMFKNVPLRQAKPSTTKVTS